MTEAEIIIEQATPADLAELLKLLASVRLPAEGVAEELEHFLVARNKAGQVVGCIGLERHGELGLLRSAAVNRAMQGTGLGSRLTAALLARSRAAGLQEIVLLTNTARDFFAHKFGFTEIDRARYDARLAASTEWQLTGCATALLMKLNLRDCAGMSVRTSPSKRK